MKILHNEKKDASFRSNNHHLATFSVLLLMLLALKQLSKKLDNRDSRHPNLSPSKVQASLRGSNLRDSF